MPISINKLTRRTTGNEEKYYAFSSNEIRRDGRLICYGKT